MPAFNTRERNELSFYNLNCRAAPVSLVCRAWRRVEREHSHRPVLLHLDQIDCNDSFMIWHLRDTSRLRELKVQGEVEYISGWDNWIPPLLNHLFLMISAPALLSLHISPLGSWGFPIKDLLPLIASLGQLESLVLRNWTYREADIAAISHLSRLQNLQVTLPDCQDHYDALYHYKIPLSFRWTRCSLNRIHPTFRYLKME